MRILFANTVVVFTLSVRRVVIHLPVSFRFLHSFRQIARAFGASSG
jgi:hypothetical protein